MLEILYKLKLNEILLTP